MNGRGVLLLAHGAPENLAAIPAFLQDVRGGGPPSAAQVAELTARYEAIGGHSPLIEIARAQAAALAAELGSELPIFLGMRHSRPRIAEALVEAERAGMRSLFVLPLIPQLSAFNRARYGDAIDPAWRSKFALQWTASWHAHPALIAAYAQPLAAARKGCEEAEVILTAHSLPRRVIEAGDVYAEQVQETARLVAAATALPRYHLAYQSAAPTGAPWLGPMLQEVILRLSGEGVRRVVIAPIGFIADHAEVLYDIDVAAHRFAAEHGVELQRSASLNTAPLLIQALADVVRKQFLAS
ncbi:MAG: ferrochelatase [Vicinamibacteria bacterium]|jgi:ferrochelatase|nr:ferrochelatase [Vicinamibacteria bacterium]